MNDKAIGSNAQRHDGPDKVRGKPIYAADDARSRMAYALPLIATAGKGHITRIDTSKAEAMPGVILVLTYKNMEKLKPMRFLFAGGQGAESLLPMQSDAVAYRGQVVALLVANTVEAAQEAVGLIDAPASLPRSDCA
jgi:xanthine dehydrogenase YagR molybdenum-binding subunit